MDFIKKLYRNIADLKYIYNDTLIVSNKNIFESMMEAAKNTWSIGGGAVDNLFASIAIMLMITVIPHMIFNAWRLRKEQKELGN